MPDPVVPPVVPPVVDPPAPIPPPAPLTLEQAQAQLAETQRALQAANHEAAERRVKLNAYEKAEADRAAAQLTETEKLTKRAADAEAAQAQALKLANERLVRAEVIAQAASLKFAQPDDALALIDRAKLTIGADGTVAGVDEQLKALAAAKPYLLARPGQAPLHPGNPGAAGDHEPTDREKLNKIYGANGASEVFGPKESRARGGGVFVKGQ